MDENYFFKIIRNAEIKVSLYNDFISEEKFFADLTPQDVEVCASFVSNFLGVELCEIEYTDDLKNEGGFIVFELNNNQIIPHKIVLRKKDLVYINEDQRMKFLETLVHEVRHIWQAQHNKIDPQERKGNVYSPSELDARAFSHLFLEYFMKPCSGYYDEKLNRALQNRENEILNEFYDLLSSYIQKKHLKDIVKDDCS